MPQNVELYAFRAIVPARKVDVRLDRLDDPFGSPTMEDIETFRCAAGGKLRRRTHKNQVVHWWSIATRSTATRSGF
jgi:hypothetical protein